MRNPAWDNIFAFAIGLGTGLVSNAFGHDGFTFGLGFLIAAAVSSVLRKPND